MQNDFLYSDTIEENIRFGRELCHEDNRPRGKNRAGGRIYFRLLRRIFPHSLSQSDKSFGRAEAEASDCKSFGVKAADPHFGRLFLRPRLPHRFQPSRCHRAKSRKYHAHKDNSRQG